MPEMIPRLAQYILKDNAILLVGAGVRRPGGPPPAVEQIAAALALEIDYQRPDRSLPAVARDYEVLKGRQALVMALKQAFEARRGETSDLLGMVADAVLPHTKVITSRFDRALELSLEHARKNYVLIVRDTDVPSFDESKITLIKLQGDIEQPDSLVITEDDIDAFADNLPTVGDVIRAYFATKTLIFLGYDLESELFKRIFRKVSRNLAAFNRPAYAVVPEPLREVDQKYWEAQNVTIHVQDPHEFLENLAAAIKTLADKPGSLAPGPLERLATPPRPSRPYKALDSFTARDVAIFSGRAEERERLVNRILAHRLTVLYGESGSGKTSLLQAGAGPRLAARQALLAICAPVAGQPLESQMVAAITRAAAEAGLQVPAGEHLEGAIGTVSRQIDGPVVLSIDPFEQVFVVYDEAERQEVAVLLRRLRDDRALDLRLVLVIREDFLGRLQALESGLLDVRFRLERLGREAARAAIEEPARLFGFTWENGLVETLLDELYAGDTRGVSPPQLQILCDYLYQALVVEGGVETITLQAYLDLGGMQAILGDYLERAVLDFPESQQAGVRRLMGALVSSLGVKQRLGLDELARAADLPPRNVNAILTELTRKRLVQRFEAQAEAGPLVTFTLTHDYLATRIVRWLGEAFWDAQKAREVVREALTDWKQRGRLLAPEDLRLVSAQAGRVQFTAEETEMIYASAVGYGVNPEQWETEILEAVREQLLATLLQHPQGSVRAETARELGACDSETAGEALARLAMGDPEAEVRQAAVEAIVATGSPSAQQNEAAHPGDMLTFRSAVASLVSGVSDPKLGQQALEALVVVRDRQPAASELLPDELDKTLRRRVWSRRWAVHRAFILGALLRGVQFGFLGLGLGVGPILGVYGIPGLEQLDLLRKLALILFGVAPAGLLGALAGGAGAFLRATLRTLPDYPSARRTWIGPSLAVGVIFGLGWWFYLSIMELSAGFSQALVGGFLMGLVLAGVATLPVRLPRLAHLALTIFIGVVAVQGLSSLELLVRSVPQGDILNFWTATLMGAIGGAGLYLALNSADMVRVPADGAG